MSEEVGNETGMTRRSLLRRGTVGAAAAVALPALQGLSTPAHAHSKKPRPRWKPKYDAGYGALERSKPVAAYTSFPDAQNIEWLALPPGFRYVVFGVAGDMMDDGNMTPSSHDGMAAFQRGRRYRLVRNHENRDGAEDSTPIGGDHRAYNPRGGAGCTTLDIVANKQGVPKLQRSWVSLNGTLVNCAGGLTPYGSWISSEETTETRDGIPHGYNFDVPARRRGIVEPIPLKEMGRFAHEAVAVDPKTGIIYETEDRGDSGFFRFVPHKRGNLMHGVLQMLKVRGETNFNLKGEDPAGFVPEVGDRFPVEWVTIDDPDPDDSGGADISKSVYNQGLARGAAIFGRLEGCWYNPADRSIVFSCTNGGPVGEGQVWEYKPRGHRHGVLRLLFDSPSGDVLSAPDNVAASPGGGILLCEDHGFDRPDDPFVPLPWSTPGDDDQVEVQYIRGLSEEGEIFEFAANLLDDKEWAGACFSPDGKYLFANTQGGTRGFVKDFAPENLKNFGRTYAIWGPWHKGAFGRGFGKK